ncbi:MAG: roadblock/LC7 domain-containing protein [Armatimonadota bacterium]|nr:MAG: roadblock/LC7 domain-containing protein [Armatimonadota bacterium]
MTQTEDLVIREKDLAELQEVLQEMLRGSQVRCVLLINRDDGSLIASEGLTDGLDTTSLAALAAGAFASARAIANLIGEADFNVLFHQGKEQHVHINVAGEHGLLMTIFDDTTTVGLVRLCARKASVRIRVALSGERG